MPTVAESIETQSVVQTIVPREEPTPSEGLTLTEIPEIIRSGTRSPGSILCGTMPDGRLKVVRPFLASIEVHDGGVVASVTEITEFGTGANVGDALHDLGKSLAELYFSLNQMEDANLSADLVAVKAFLGQHLELLPISKAA